MTQPIAAASPSYMPFLMVPEDTVINVRTRQIQEIAEQGIAAAESFSDERMKQQLLSVKVTFLTELENMVASRRPLKEFKKRTTEMRANLNEIIRSGNERNAEFARQQQATERSVRGVLQSLEPAPGAVVVRPVRFPPPPTCGPIKPKAAPPTSIGDALRGLEPQNKEPAAKAPPSAIGEHLLRM